MALRHAILAALLEGEASGYELSKRFDVSVANFWSASPQQLYRELDTLSDEGLLDARVVEQQRRPNKRVFSITEAGLGELAAFTALPARPLAIRDELLIKLQAADVGDIDAVRTAISERRQQAEAKLAIYDALHDDLLAGRSEAVFLRETERVGPYLTLMRGRSFERENVDWCDTVLSILERRTRAARAES